MTKKKNILPWSVIQQDMTREGIKSSFLMNRMFTLAKDEYSSTEYDEYWALAIAIRDRLVERWIKTQQRYHKQNLKRVYYLSMEFLIGRLLGNNIINLGLWEEVASAMEDLGYDITDLREIEVDAGLGNGGLGRLAACYLDSMATLGIPAHGYGIRYEYGIFNQKIENGYQIERPDEWLTKGNPWEFIRPEYTVKVHFYGRPHMYQDEKARLCFKWIDTQDVLAVPYDIPVPGYKNDVVNTLRLWSARSSEEFDFDYFNDGDYEQAVMQKVHSENIAKVLYPNDEVSQGRELRLKQEYFFTAASIADIIRRFKVENMDIREFPNKAAIHLNDTHPALAVVELMRLLLDEFFLDWDTAWDITTRTFAYTNHTIMPEALECWPVPLVDRVLPRHLQIIYEINMRFLQEVANQFPGEPGRLRRMSIIDEGDPKKIRMAYLSIIASHSVNGVSRLHTELLQTKLFKDFYDIDPAKFNNKTNGITPRRWLLKANPGLSQLITESIGENWPTHLQELKNLEPFKHHSSFVTQWRRIKEDNKKQFAEYIHQTMKISVDPQSIFDVQVKRIHEYKRQLLFAFYIIAQYLRAKNDAKASVYPRTFIVGGKAAPGYFTAKLIIKFFNSVADVVNNDKAVKQKLKVVFMENYRVSLAEKIFPGSDLSEQISTAGTEASGTGNMKFMINGALTIGTWDGANIEIAQAVGQDHIFIFGHKIDEIERLRMAGYNPKDFVNRSPILAEIFHLINTNFFAPYEPGIFSPLVHSVYHYDPFLICADFDSYCTVQNTVEQVYQDETEWAKRSIVNVAHCGKFSSDRAVEEYAREIWGIPLVK